MHNLIDATFNGMPGSEFYRAQVFPELYPHERPMLLDYWPIEDIEMYCLGLTLEERFARH